MLFILSFCIDIRNLSRWQQYLLAAISASLSGAMAFCIIGAIINIIIVFAEVTFSALEKNTIEVIGGTIIFLIVLKIRLRNAFQ